MPLRNIKTNASHHLLSQNKSAQTMSLTSACWVHSNVDALDNIHWIRYLTAVDPLLSISCAMQKYHHLLSGSVEILWRPTGNSTCIGEEPIPEDRLIFTSTTGSEVSHAEQGTLLYCITNVLQVHETVVLVCCTIEREPDITCMWESKG